MYWKCFLDYGYRFNGLGYRFHDDDRGKKRYVVNDWIIYDIKVKDEEKCVERKQEARKLTALDKVYADYIPPTTKRFYLKEERCKRPDRDSEIHREKKSEKNVVVADEIDKCKKKLEKDMFTTKSDSYNFVHLGYGSPMYFGHEKPSVDPPGIGLYYGARWRQVNWGVWSYY
jgi:hypothetical protein